jgi:tyrosine-protein kinase Etk/Wzc
LEKFRYLGHRLQQLRSKRTLSRVLVTSAIPKEGKTVVSVNLAAVLARSSSRVLLIDADMRQANVRGLLGEPSRTGLADLLEGRETLSSALRFIDLLGIFYLPAGFPSSNPVELLQGQRMRDLMQATAASFRR